VKLLATRPWTRTVAFYAGVTLTSLAVLVWALQLTRVDLGEPFTYRSDALEWHLLVKNTLETGWYLSNERLGAPFGMEFHDYPQPEALHYLQVKVLGLLSDNPFLIVNCLYLLGFPLATLSALWVCRRLGLSRGPAAVVSLLYAFVPYHLERGEGHLWLSAYYTVPLLILLALWTSGTEPFLFDAGATGPWPRWRVNRRRAVVAATVCLMGGSTGVYYAFFACALLGLGALCSSLASRRLGPLWTASLLVALLGAVVVANLTPNVWHRLREGGNPHVAVRSPGESEIYGLKLTQMVLPVAKHRLAPLRALRDRYDGSSPLRNENANAIGLVGSTGFFILLGSMFLRRRDPNHLATTRLAELNLIALLLGTMGGMGALFAYTVSPMIRGYNRISIFIAFLALVMVGFLLERAARALSTRRHGRVLARGAFAVVGVAGLLDQVPAGQPFDYAGAAAERRSDGVFFAAVEARHSPRAMVFQLPYHPFPESPPQHLLSDYDPVRPFLNTRAMRWSYGASRGRAGDEWLRETSSRPLPELVETITLAGYEALAIDRHGYADAGVGLETSLSGLVGVKPSVSPNRRTALFDLRPFQAALRARLGEHAWARRSQQVREPVLFEWGDGCHPPEGKGEHAWRWCASTGELRLANRSSHPRRVQLAFDLSTGHPEPARMELSGPLLAARLTVSARPSRFRQLLTVPPGTHRIRMHTDAQKVSAPGDPRSLAFRVDHFRILEAE
jgi:phosphoglycerol transferase